MQVFVSKHWKSQQSTRPSPLLFAAVTWSHLYGKSKPWSPESPISTTSISGQWQQVIPVYNSRSCMDCLIQQFINMPLKACHVLPWILQLRARSPASQTVTAHALIEYKTLSKCSCIVDREHFSIFQKNKATTYLTCPSNCFKSYWLHLLRERTCAFSHKQRTHEKSNKHMLTYPHLLVVEGMRRYNIF